MKQKKKKEREKKKSKNESNATYPKSLTIFLFDLVIDIIFFINHSKLKILLS